LLFAAATGCGVREDLIARVGSRDILIDELQAYLEAVAGTSWQAADERVAARILDQYLDQEVVAAAARRRGEVDIPTEPGDRSARVRSLIGEVCGPVPRLPSEAVAEEVERRLGELRPARARVRQMLLSTLEEAEQARARLETGESFVDVSRDMSRAPNAEGGGELGMVVQGTLPSELEAVIFALAPEEITGPVQGPGGYHIFQVLEIVPEGPARRSELEVEVRHRLTEERARDFTRECVDRLAVEVGVTLIREHLWFRYEGRYGETDDEN
jgi:parvulin-like peptidyl-prolyl isomerase